MGALIGQCGLEVPPSLPVWQDHTGIAARMGDRVLTNGLAGVIGSIGRDGFGDRLASLLLSVADIEQVNVMSLEGHHARCLFSWRREHPDTVSSLIRRYVGERFYRNDPTLRRLKQSPQSGLRLEMMHRVQIEDECYRHIFFDEAGLEGKLSILEPNQPRVIYQNYYFSDGRRSFCQGEIEALALLAETVSQCILRHSELTETPPPRSAEAVSRILARCAPSLAGRERDVCCRIITGYTTEAIALDLGISPNSVSTYRKRAYSKLNICSQNQLFMLCLGAHSRAGPIFRGGHGGQ